MIDIDDPTKWQKRKFFVIGSECQLFGDMINGEHYASLRDAMAALSPKDRAGIYYITIDSIGHKFDDQWYPTELAR